MLEQRRAVIAGEIILVWLRGTKMTQFRWFRHGRWFGGMGWGLIIGHVTYHVQIHMPNWIFSSTLPQKTNDEKEPCTLNQIACLCVPSILILNFVDNLTSSAECSKNWNKKRSNKKHKNETTNPETIITCPLLHLFCFNCRASERKIHQHHPMDLTLSKKLDTENQPIIELWFFLYFYLLLWISHKHTHTHKKLSPIAKIMCKLI